MITGGDEMGRTLFGNNNPWNLDSPINWLNWKQGRQLNPCSRSHAACSSSAAPTPRCGRPSGFEGKDHNGNGLKDVTWYRETGGEPDGGYFDNGQPLPRLSLRRHRGERPAPPRSTSASTAGKRMSRPPCPPTSPASPGSAWPTPITSSKPTTTSAKPVRKTSSPIPLMASTGLDPAADRTLNIGRVRDSVQEMRRIHSHR